MSPELATRTTDPGTPLDDLLAELALAEKWPTPEGYCHRCGFGPCFATEDTACILAEPLPLDDWLTLAAADAVFAVFGHLPVDVRRSVRFALGRQLGERIASLYTR